MKTSDLFKRSKQLADFEGSDFITWNEAVNCINESNVALYEKLINMGDNSFVSSFRMAAKEKLLPEDFWQLKGVYLWNNGNLQVINRRADADGIHHLSYELRNGSIYLYGNPNDVLVEYYPKPKKLFFKPNSVIVDLDAEKKYLDCCKHSFLFEDITDLEEPCFSVTDIDGIKNVNKVLIGIEPTDIVGVWLTDNYIFVRTVSTLYIYDIARNVESNIDAFPVVSENGEVFLMQDGIVKSFIIRVLPGLTYVDTKNIGAYELIDGGLFYVCNDSMNDFYYLKNGTIWFGTVNTEIIANKIIYADKKCYYLNDSEYGYIENELNKVIEQTKGDNIGFIGIDERTGFGYCSKKYGKYFVIPYCEDTELNYPNSTYFQIISYILAIAFKSKQGADISLLQNELEMIEQTFEETLGSDAFQFPRMGNVYN